jgi:uncharacterized protein (TIGR02996 family)
MTAADVDAVFRRAIQLRPRDALAYAAYADALEESGRAGDANAVRLLADHAGGPCGEMVPPAMGEDPLAFARGVVATVRAVTGEGVVPGGACWAAMLNAPSIANRGQRGNERILATVWTLKICKDLGADVPAPVEVHLDVWLYVAGVLARLYAAQVPRGEI